MALVGIPQGHLEYILELISMRATIHFSVIWPWFGCLGPPFGHHLGALDRNFSEPGLPRDALWGTCASKHGFQPFLNVFGTPFGRHFGMLGSLFCDLGQSNDGLGSRVFLKQPGMRLQSGAGM